MAEFKRSRLERKSEEQVTKKTVFLGFATVSAFIIIVIFGLPFLIKFSVFLGDAKVRKNKEVGEKVIPPLAPRLVIPFDATNSATIKISGFAEPNVEVELLKNDVSIGKKTVNTSGEFSYDDVNLEEGSNYFTTLAVSEKGGSSEMSKVLEINYDSISPDLKMISPTDETIKVEVDNFEIVGQVEKDNSVTINGRIVMLEDDGNFKHKVDLINGKNQFEIKVKDSAGNETKKTLVINSSI